MSQLPKFEHYLRQAAIDAVLSEALELAGFGPLVPYSLDSRGLGGASAPRGACDLRYIGLGVEGRSSDAS